MLPVPRRRLIPIISILALNLTWLVPAAHGGSAAPQPNPLAPVAAGGNAIFAPVPGANLTATGPAAAVHGDPARGRVLFAQNCTTCHGDRGLGGVANPGSDDGTVPTLNPIDPGFLADSQGDPGAFAADVDLFVQHGSRPAGDSPQLSMIGWGDHKLRSQQDLADIEAYVMQLNGVYWPDRWAPPAEVHMTATQDGSTITYSITLINQGANPLTGIQLSDTLPAGLTYLSSGVPGLGQNPGAKSGNTISWLNLDGVPQGGTLGPFVITAQSQGNQVPANVASVSFGWTNWNGTSFTTTAVSDPVVPGTPKAKASTAPPALPTLAAGPVTSPTPVASQPAPSASASAQASAASSPSPAATPAPANTPAPAATAAPAQNPSSFSAQIVEPSAGALSWGFSPSSLNVHVGDSVTWSNAGTLGHTVTADDGSFDSGTLNPGDSWSMTFSNPGTYSFHCTPHPWMKGTVVVQ